MTAYIEKYDVFLWAIDSKGNTLPFYGKTSKDKKIIRLQLNKKKLACRDRLIQSVKKGDLPDVKAVLQRHIQLINRPDDDGYTALMWAATHGQLEIIRYLVSQQAENKVFQGEHTALSFAAYNKRYNIVRFLLENMMHTEALIAFAKQQAQAVGANDIVQLLGMHISPATPADRLSGSESDSDIEDEGSSPVLLLPQTKLTHTELDEEIDEEPDLDHDIGGISSHALLAPSSELTHTQLDEDTDEDTDLDHHVAEDPNMTESEDEPDTVSISPHELLLPPAFVATQANDIPVADIQDFRSDLFGAINEMNYAVVERLISDCASIHDMPIQRVFEEACVTLCEPRFNDTNMLEKLIAQLVERNLCRDGKTLVMHAVVQKNLKSVNYVRAHVRMDLSLTPEQQAESPLVYAVRHNETHLASFFD